MKRGARSDSRATEPALAEGVLLQGAGGRGSICNGIYQISGKHNGKPLYVKDGDKCKIYFSDYWKISPSGSTSGWIYGVDSAAGKGPFPPTCWRDDGYASSDNRPFPTLEFVGPNCTTAGAAESRFEDMPALKTFFRGIDMHIGAYSRGQSEWLLDFRALCAVPLCSDSARRASSDALLPCTNSAVTFDCYVAMAILLSLNGNLLKTKKLEPGHHLTKAHLEEAIRNAVIPQIKSAIRKLRTHLNKKATERRTMNAGSAASPETGTADGGACEETGTADGGACEEDDIVIVMEQTGVDRTRAIAALVEHRDAAGAILAIEEQMAAHGVRQDAAPAADMEELKGDGARESVDGAGPDPKIEDDVRLQQLAVIVTRISLIMMHLVNSLPLAALSVDLDASFTGEVPANAGTDTRLDDIVPSFKVLDEKNQQDDNICDGIAAAPACGGVAQNFSLRRLLGAGTQMMLKEHKAPLIQKIFDANPIAHASRADVSVDRFPSLGSPLIAMFRMP